MNRLLRLARYRPLQPFWYQLHRLSLIGMNFWSSEFEVTGERESLRFVAKHLSDIGEPVIFDVGANVGDFTTACLKAFGRNCRLYAFEPSAETFAMLRTKVQDPRVSVHQLGFSDREGTGTLHSSGRRSSIASLLPLERPVRPFDAAFDERVRLTTIDRFSEKHGIGSIDFLKLDIEGHELNALIGAARMIREGRIKAVQFEFGENNVSARSFLSDFHKLLTGFDFYRAVPGGPVVWNYAGGRSEIFATMNYLAVRRTPPAHPLISSDGPTL